MATDKIQYLRDDVVSVGNLQLCREVYLEPNGMLSQELGIWDAEHENLIRPSLWQFEVDGDPRQHLQSLDDCWDRQSNEFVDIVEHAQRYAAIKSGGDKQKDAFIPLYTLNHTSDILLNQFPSDEDVASGYGDAVRSTLVPFSHRYMSLREAGNDLHYELDAYEMAVTSLNKSIADAIGGYDNVLHGFDANEQHQNLDKEEFASPDEPSEYDNDREYGGGTAFAASDEDSDHDAPWRQQDTDSWQQDGDAWKSSDADKERNDEIDRMIVRYLDQMNHFVENAEAAWLEAASQVRSGEPLHSDPRHVAAMKYWMGEAQASYSELKQAWQDSGLSSFELSPVYEHIEDEEKGAEATMQKLVSIAGRPELLEDTIRKGLPKTREK